MAERCKACGSDRIIPDLSLLDSYGDFGGLKQNLQVQVEGNPRAWVFKDTVAGCLVARICGDCGHTELRTTNHQELYEKYLKSREQS